METKMVTLYNLSVIKTPEKARSITFLSKHLKKTQIISPMIQKALHIIEL
jgi:hypothetical protein